VLSLPTGNTIAQRPRCRMYVQWSPTGSRSRPGVSPVSARLNSRLWHRRSWSVATTAGTSVRNIWCCFAVVWMLPVWQIFPGAVWWINVVQCCYTVLNSSRIGSWAMTVYFTYCQSYRCCQSAPCNSSHVRWRYPVIVLLRFQNVSSRSVSIGFAEKTSVFGSV